MTNIQIIIVSLIAVFSFILGVISAFVLVKSFIREITSHVIEECMTYRDFIDEHSNNKQTD